MRLFHKKNISTENDDLEEAEELSVEEENTKEENKDKDKEKSNKKRKFFKRKERKPKKEKPEKPPTKLTIFSQKHPLIFNLLLSLFLCFFVEALSRHSVISAVYFVARHPIPFLYNSYVIFVFYSLCFIFRRRRFVRNIVSAIFILLGIINCIILLNRVTPFGFTDLNMIGDLLTMQGTSYFTPFEGFLCLVALVIYTFFTIKSYKQGSRHKDPKPKKKAYPLVLAAFISLPLMTVGLQAVGGLQSYFGNMAQGYLDNGYLYGFSMSMFGRGMSKPALYSESEIDKLINKDEAYAKKATEEEIKAGGDSETGSSYSTLDAENGPNIIIILMESYVDPSEISFLNISEDPNPFFHELENNYSTGYCTVPVVGAGTCNTEFEVLTGMSVHFFGPGEYPQKTILKKTDCESVAADLRNVGYNSHVVHNNGGNFYSRRNAFSMMGFDTFQSKEMLDITDYTPLGSWPTDDILTGATKDALDSTANSDFVYTITVSTHGNYPTEKIIKNPEINVTAEGKTEEVNNQWEYYVNMIHQQDEWLKSYIDMLSERNEPTLVIGFGDHLPMLGINDYEVKSGDLFKTKYITWNNFGMEKKDMDLTSYQLASEYLDRLGFHDGTIVSYNQRMTNAGQNAASLSYMRGLDELQYDLLYGERYAYNGEDKYPATNIEMGIADVKIDRLYHFNNKIYIYGDRFTKWSDVYVNGEYVKTKYRSGQLLTISDSDIKDGDVISVAQVGSNETIFRRSNYVVYHDINPGEERETDDETEENDVN